MPVSALQNLISVAVVPGPFVLVRQNLVGVLQLLEPLRCLFNSVGVLVCSGARRLHRARMQPPMHACVRFANRSLTRVPDQSLFPVGLLDCIVICIPRGVQDLIQALGLRRHDALWRLTLHHQSIRSELRELMN